MKPQVREILLIVLAAAAVIFSAYKVKTANAQVAAAEKQVQEARDLTVKAVSTLKVTSQNRDTWMEVAKEAIDISERCVKGRK